MKLHIFQNSEIEKPGAILDWAKSNKVEIQIVEVFKGQALPDTQDVEATIVLGAPISANEPNLAWLNEQRDFLKLLISNNKKILGICLGAQILVQAQGGTISKGRASEVGWHLVDFRFSQCRGHLNTLVNEKIEIFQFHSEVFSTVEKSVNFGSSRLSENQGLEINQSTLAFAGHIEITEALVTDYLQNFKKYLNKNDFDHLSLNLEERIRLSQQLLFKVLSAWSGI